MSYYNDMATLVFNSQESAIKQLFHQNGRLVKQLNQSQWSPFGHCFSIIIIIMFRSFLSTHSLDYIYHILFHCLLDIWSWYSQWIIHSVDHDWSIIWKICGYSFCVS